MSSSSSKQDEKRKKKLKSFFDKNASLNRRWKSLISYVEKASDDDLNKFFNDNFYMIYGVFFDSFTAYENSCKKGKHSSTDVNDMMLVLRNVLTHLSELIRKKWQTRSIAAVLEKLLYKENKINVRVPGFALLLVFLEAVQVLEATQIDLFASAIDMSVFAVGPNQATRFRKVALTAPDKTCVLVPSTNAGNPENSVKLWDDMLAYVTNKPAVFDFWIGHLKNQYFSIFYPEVAKRCGFSDDDCGFTTYCPHPIQKVNITYLEHWLGNEQISTIMWAGEDNIQLMLEFFRQSCHLPMAYTDTIRASISIFKKLFITGGYKLPAEVEARTVEFRQFFFQQLASVFIAREEQQEHVKLCLEVVNEFKQIFLEKYDAFALETQECLLNTLLQATIDVSRSSTLAGPLSAKMLDTVFFIWIRTKRNTEVMWDNLQRGVSSTFHQMESVIQTKNKIIQLTLLIKTKMYPFKVVKKKPVKRDIDGNEQPKKEVPKSVCPDQKQPLQLPPLDPDFSTMEWTIDDLIYVWNQVLQTFRDVNSITDPAIHAAAIAVLVEVIEILKRAEEGIPIADRPTMEREPLCLVNIFGHWLFEACYMPDAFIKGKATAIGALCNLIVRHYGDSLPLELLSHFYGIVAHCLKNNSHSIVSWAIITNSSNIFNLALPGCNVLIPHYMEEVKKELLDTSVSKDVRLKGILIVCSLICYPSHLTSLSCPVAFNSNTEYDFAGTLTEDITSVLLNTANCDPDPEHKVLCIWGLCTLVFENLTHGGDVARIKEVTKIVIPFCTSTEPIVARAALDSLSTLTLQYSELAALDETLIHIIVETLGSNILRLFLEAKQSKAGALNENLIADHFYCLLDWIMASTNYLFSKRTLAEKVFEAIEIGLLGQKLQGTVDQICPDKKKSKRLSSAVPQSYEAQLSELLEFLTEKPTHGSNVVKEAAHILLIQLCNFLQNFPCKEGIEIMSSKIMEADDVLKESKPLFFIYNDFALFSLVEVPLPDGSHMARLILRDCTGKYAWDSVINYNNYIHKIPPPYSLLSEPVHPPAEKDLIIVTQSNREPGNPPREHAVDGPPVDQLDDLLQYLGEVFPDCLPSSGNPLNQPSAVKEEYKNSVQFIESALLEQDQIDSNAIQQIADNQPPYEDWAVIPPQPTTPASALHHCRLFLNHLGFLTFEKQSSFSMVDYSQRFTRSLQQLDKCSGREMLKIGVIYVKEGQDNQNDIFRNDTKSDLYAEFVRGLGWPIDVATHRGYLGGLDPKQTTGVSAPYYANSIMEVIFHEITSMPTNPTDVQQIHKKRHVGNDIVHIVYSEGTSDYNPTTITTQFNDAHIVVYPLPNGLFRVQIYRKANVQLFGPLIHGMCVSKELLAPLVRQTAINANRYVRYNTGGYTRPFPTRRRALDEIVNRFKVTRPYAELVNELLD